MRMQDKILIVEDEGLIAFDLAVSVSERLGNEVFTADSVAEARARLQSNDVGLALLDVDVRDGKTFGLARELLAKGIPFVFTSAVRRGDVPGDLSPLPFLAKPCCYPELFRLLDALVGKSIGHRDRLIQGF